MFPRNDLKTFLENKVVEYNTPAFVKDDPISIPHTFSKQEDIEIASFLTATIAWGQRPVILKNAGRLMHLMEQQPHLFILNAGKKEKQRFRDFVHRTFNGTDVVYFIEALQNIYSGNKNFETIFSNELSAAGGDMGKTISMVRQEFFIHGNAGRTTKHFSDPMANSAAKRINMMLRWLVRKDKKGVDFGLWKSISPAHLYCPLDVHSGRVARKLGILKRKQDDWKAVVELTENLRQFDAKDPVKYDFALFGLGVYERF